MLVRELELSLKFVCSIRATNLIRLILVLVGLKRVVFRFNRVVARFTFIIRGCGHLKLLLTNVCTSLCASSYTVRIPSALLLYSAYNCYSVLSSYSRWVYWR